MITDYVPWLECIPNFSEGNRPEVLDRIREAAARTGVTILGMESDPDHNRAVLTFAGPAPAVLAAALASARVAVETIDMRAHHGTHPRIGAVDVVPLVPIVPADMPYAIECSRQLGRQLAEELGLPVYLYAQSAANPEHRKLAAVRRGQFEGLAARMATDPPDFGPLTVHPTAGAVAVGARRPLIAFNAYLSTTDVRLAQQVARQVRGVSGGLVGVQALAMDTVHQGMVQVSMNLVDYPTTTLPTAVEMVRREAERLGVAVVRTELVGLMPAQALLDVARYYLQCPDLAAGDVLEWALSQASNPPPQSPYLDPEPTP